MESLKKQELIDLCKKKNINSTGTKKILLSRLKKHDEEEENNIPAQLFRLKGPPLLFPDVPDSAADLPQNASTLAQAGGPLDYAPPTLRFSQHREQPARQ